MAKYIQNDFGICPYCGHRVNATFHQIINLTYRQDIQTSLETQSINMAKCLFCEKDFRFEAEMFAIELRKKYAVLVSSKDNKENLSILKTDIYKMIFGGEYKLRFVTTCLELLEKIRIFNAGIDDRCVEIAKQLYFTDIMDNLDKDYRFLVREISDKSLIFILYDDHDNIVSEHKLLRKVFDTINIENDSTDFSGYVEINNKWAENYLGEKEN